LTKKYHSYVDDPTDEFDTKLLNTLETLYEAFYNMWTQHKIMIVPAPTEIGEQVENALMLYRDTAENLQEEYKNAFNAYFKKLENVGYTEWDVRILSLTLLTLSLLVLLN